MEFKSLIRTVPNYPKEGIMFRDITTLLKDEKGFRAIIDKFAARYEGWNIDKVVGIESRGFIIGSVLSYVLGKGFIPLRKAGKLPGETYSAQYELEYGFDKLEIHKDALKKGEKVLLVDDILATGGTALGAISLIERLEAEVSEFCTVVNLPDLKGERRVKENGYSLYSLCEFSGH